MDFEIRLESLVKWERHPDFASRRIAVYVQVIRVAGTVSLAGGVGGGKTGGVCVVIATSR